MITTTKKGYAVGIRTSKGNLYIKNAYKTGMKLTPNFYESKRYKNLETAEKREAELIELYAEEHKVSMKAPKAEPKQYKCEPMFAKNNTNESMKGEKTMLTTTTLIEKNNSNHRIDFIKEEHHNGVRMYAIEKWLGEVYDTENRTDFTDREQGNKFYMFCKANGFEKAEPKAEPEPKKASKKASKKANKKAKKAEPKTANKRSKRDNPFIVGNEYWCRDWNDKTIIYRYTVTARTEETVTLKDENGNEKEHKVYKGWKGEYTFPTDEKNPILVAIKPRKEQPKAEPKKEQPKKAEPKEQPKGEQKFEVGKIYSCRSLTDWDCIWNYLVASRTAKTVTLNDDIGEKVVRKIKVSDGSEYVMPQGRYSMAPVLRADNR